MLHIRIITSIILIPFIIFLLFYLSKYNFYMFFIFICMISIWEWGDISGLTSYKKKIILSITLGLLLFLIISIINKTYSLFVYYIIKYILLFSLIWWIFAFFILINYPKSSFLWKKYKFFKLIFGIIIILLFFFGILSIRQYNYNINIFSGSWLMLYIITLVCSVDSGSYFFGKIFGNNKIALKISPNKTLEGLIGGIITSILTFLLFRIYSPIDILFFKFIICSIFSVLTSILGDLIESMFKREAGIKDSSYLIPGHGGILDLIDSLIAAIPIFACLIIF